MTEHFGIEGNEDLRQVIEVIRAGLFSTRVSVAVQENLLTYCQELEDYLDEVENPDTAICSNCGFRRSNAEFHDGTACDYCAAEA